jgi:2-polyprenyl-3-methyl-5-hydroxy-6-metoxy-1,4-benzoquinol methylase
MYEDNRYYISLAAAFARGKLPELAGLSDTEVVRHALNAGLRLHKFKRNAQLPRVRRVIGVVHGLAPSVLVDIGSGRGTFLWPLIDAMPGLRVVSVDLDARRAADVQAVRAGGIERLVSAQMDGAQLGLASKSADVVTLLEVLEHMPRPDKAIAEAIRVARAFVVVSVPSKEDDNPEHIHVFDNAMLERMLTGAGARRVTFDGVLNHRILVASL